MERLRRSRGPSGSQQWLLYGLGEEDQAGSRTGMREEWAGEEQEEQEELEGATQNPGVCCHLQWGICARVSRR